MMRVLLDENIPAGLRKLLPGHEATLLSEVGLAGASNGALLVAAERQGFDVLVTADRNLAYQQNLAGRAIAVIVLGTNHWGTIRQNSAPIVEALTRCGRGSVMEVKFDQPLSPR